MAGQQIVWDTLEREGIPYRVIEHEAVYTVEAMDQLNLPQYGTIVKNLFLRDNKGKRHFLLCMPESCTIDLKSLRTVLGTTNLSFASAERMEKYLGVSPGSVSPFGILNDDGRCVEVVFDESLRGNESVGVHPNENTATVFLRFEDLLRVVESHGNQVSVIAL